MGGGLAGGNVVGNFLGIAGSVAIGAGVRGTVGRAVTGNSAAAARTAASGAAASTVVSQAPPNESDVGAAAPADRALRSSRPAPGSPQPMLAAPLPDQG
jgi:hypothetical protein